MNLLKVTIGLYLFIALMLAVTVAEDSFRKPYRSSAWPKIRQQHLNSFPYCVMCGSDRKLEVHHVIPFSVDPALELVTNNLITLCRTGGSGCHFFVGHCGVSWSYDNTNIISVTKHDTGRILYEQRQHERHK